MARICWQPSASLPLEIGSPARISPDCVTIHEACVPVRSPRCHGPAMQLVSECTGCPHGQRLAFSSADCHAFEPRSRVSRPGFEVSPPNPLQNKHTAAAFTSSSISGFAEWFNSEHHSQHEGYKPPPQSNSKRSHSLVHIKTYALKTKIKPGIPLKIRPFPPVSQTDNNLVAKMKQGKQSATFSTITPFYFCILHQITSSFITLTVRIFISKNISQKRWDIFSSLISKFPACQSFTHWLMCLSCNT